MHPRPMKNTASTAWIGPIILAQGHMRNGWSVALVRNPFVWTLTRFLRMRAMSQLWIFSQRPHLASLDLGKLSISQSLPSQKGGFVRTPSNPGLTKPCSRRLCSLMAKPNKLFIRSRTGEDLPHASYANALLDIMDTLFARPVTANACALAEVLISDH